MITAIERDLILASLIAAGEAWDPAGLFLGVYVSGYAPTLTLTLADLVLPPGSLATAIAVATWGDAHVKSDGRAMVTGAGIPFRPADYTEATVVEGWYIADTATDGELLMAEPFPNGSIALPDETVEVTIVPRLVVTPEGTVEWHAMVVHNG